MNLKCSLLGSDLHIIADEQIYRYEKMPLERDLGRTLGGGYVVAEERAVRAVLLFLDRHREFLERLRVEPALAQHPRQFTSKGALMVLACEERDRLARLATTTCAQGGSFEQGEHANRVQGRVDVPVRPIRWM